MKKRRGALTVVTAIVLGACTPGAPSRQTPSACTWTIGIMGALSGDFAHFAKPGARSVELAVEQANESGELPCTLQLHKEDTQGDPNQAPAVAEELVEDEDLVACVCGFFSGETLATGQIFNEGNVAMLSTGEISIIRNQGFGTWFRLVAPSDEQGRVTGIYIRRVLGARRVAIAYDGQSYSREIARNVRDELGWRFDGPMIRMPTEENGPDVVAEEVKRKSPDPDAVFFGGYGEQAWTLRRSLTNMGVRALFITDGGAKDAREARLVDAPKGVVSCACLDVSGFDDNEARAFVESYKERFGRKPTQHAPDAFDGTNVVIDALDDLTGAETTEDVRAHVVSFLRSYGPEAEMAKTLSWDRKGEMKTTLRHVYIWEWRNGFRFLGSVGGLTRR